MGWGDKNIIKLCWICRNVVKDGALRRLCDEMKGLDSVNHYDNTTECLVESDPQLR